MKKCNIFIALVLSIFLSTGMVFADNDKTEPNSGINPSGKYDRNGFDNGNAWWKGNNDNGGGGGCQGPACSGGSGVFGSYANAGNAQGVILSQDGVFGANGGFGFGNSLGGGVIFNGIGSSSSTATGGSVGITNLVSAPGVLGSESYNLAKTGATLDLGVDPTGRFLSGGFGAGEICGLAGQGTINLVHITNVDGETFGGAAQGSIGGFHGGVVVAAGPDGRRTDSKDFANIGAGITMEGGSYAISGQIAPVTVDGVTKSGLGSNVGAYTILTSFVNGPVSGGWIAGGGAVTKTVMEGASAGAFGVYTGSGPLGCNYNGSAVGQSYVQKTTVEGMNGAIYNSGSSMAVTSKVTKNTPN